MVVIANLGQLVSGVVRAGSVSAFIQNRHFGFANQSVVFVKLSSEQAQTNTDGTMESNTKSVFAENNLFETSDNRGFAPQPYWMAGQ